MCCYFKRWFVCVSVCVCASVPRIERVSTVCSGLHVHECAVIASAAHTIRFIRVLCVYAFLYNKLRQSVLPLIKPAA